MVPDREQPCVNCGQPVRSVGPGMLVHRDSRRVSCELYAELPPPDSPAGGMIETSPGEDS